MADSNSVHTNSTRSITNVDIEMTPQLKGCGSRASARVVPASALPTIKEIECEWSFPYELFMIIGSTIAVVWTWYITLDTWIEQDSTIIGEDFLGVVILATVSSLFVMFINSLANSIAFRNGHCRGACGCICYKYQCNKEELQIKSIISMTWAFWEMVFLLFSSGSTLFHKFDVFVTDDVSPLVSLGIWYYVPTLVYIAMLIYHLIGHAFYHRIAHFDEDDIPPINVLERLLYIFIECVCIALMIYLEPVSFDRVDKTIFNNIFIGMAVSLGVKLLIAVFMYLIRCGLIVKFLKYVWCCKCRIVNTSAGSDV